MEDCFFPIYTCIPTNPYKSLFENYSKEKFDNTLISLSNDFLNYKNNELAGRLYMYQIVKNTGTITDYLENFKDILEPTVYNYMKSYSDIIQKFLDFYDYLNYHEQDFFSVSTYAKNYLLRVFYKDQPLETPLLMYLRILVYLYGGTSETSERSNRLPITSIFKKVVTVASKYYTFASPTLYNLGTKHSQGSSCFLGTLSDNLEHGILETGIKDSGVISQKKGGIGLGITQLRHSSIKGGGMASGVVPVMHLIEKLILYVDQTGSRSGAATVHIHDWHLDVEEFITLKSNSQPEKDRLEFLNTCVWLSDLFIERCKADAEWTLFCPSRVDLYSTFSSTFEQKYTELEQKIVSQDIYEKDLKERYKEASENMKCRKALTAIVTELKEFERKKIVYRRIKAVDLLNKICTVEIGAGMPYVMYPDSINTKNNQANIGSITSSNLCVEIVEVTDENRIASCNLSSISLKKFINIQNIQRYKELKTNSNIKEALINSELVDYRHLNEITREVVRNLNSIIDKNDYPVPHKTKDLNLKARPLGIGVSGFDDAVKLCDFLFESEEADILNKVFFSIMYYAALDESCNMAISNGEPYYYFDKGTFYLETVNSDLDYTETQIEKLLFKGSPFKNGLFQFDLWKIRATVLKHRSRLDESVYNRADDEPLYIYHSKEWNELKHKVMKHGVMNSLLLTCMPTASTAQILSNTESTEVPSSNLYTRVVNSGTFIVLNKYLLKDFENIGLYNGDLIEYLKFNKGSVKGIDHFLRTL
jgi:ribonucleoside-diphosphate reductase alpha chain